MNIQSIGQSYYTSSMYSRTMSGTGQSSFEIPEAPMDSSEIMAQDDANEDGVLTIDETQLSEEMFASADSDSDGELTSDELEEMLAIFPPPPMGGAGGMAPPDAASIMETDDENEDGVLTIDETPLSEEMFASADTDEDGEITSEELEAYLSSAPTQPAGAGETAFSEIIAAASPQEIISAYANASSNFISLFGQTDESTSYESLLSGLVV